MNTELTIDGVNFTEGENNSYLCHIDNISDELKGKIRFILPGIFHGAKQALENEDIFDYTKTVQDFWSRYNSKTISTKKGMIGELLVHVLLPHYLNNLSIVSIMKNKEESSIKKGFDLVYYNENDKNIWYTEVKSGEAPGEVNTKNVVKLNEAKKGIKSMVDSDRIILWQSVLADVKFTIFNSEKELDIIKLLKSDYPGEKKTEDLENKNVILGTVIYKNLAEKISIESMNNYKSQLDSGNYFLNSIIFSIQKSTYSKVEDFLKKETNDKRK